MKVVKKGREQTGWAHEYECTGKGNGNGGCGAVLLVEQPDIFKTFNHCMGEKDTFLTFKCSECGVLTDIDGNSIKKYPCAVPRTVWGAAPTQSEWENRTNGE